MKNYSIPGFRVFADGVGEDADAGEQQWEGVDPNSVRHHPAEQLQRTFQRTRIDHRQGGARKRCLLFFSALF